MLTTAEQKSLDDARRSAPGPAATAARPGGRAWWVLAVLCFVYVLNFLDRQLLSIPAKPIRDDLKITDGQPGLISGLYFALFYCLVAIPVGWLADRTNRVRVLSGALLLLVMNLIGLGLGPAYLGAASDFFRENHPENSLQLASCTLIPFYFLAIALFLWLARALRREAEVGGGSR